ncbi:hypothetical protein CONPUDRAFT_166994 [Coniophora puteana RWD-64-598 SS2]|uniref:Uncharacterized protein n=1 Tax=Coniophora puteana (strain RWD-64-598) TaxID=741705 RepID=A0A5M3MJV0_CONPW|nr:uncharacterized protein CONPUDRAFT_166994 [Coniophora puteana RWD-64-598 SS2]EIW79210.1 hypothetical protein CONPUDRAFT_166994 [Coniophora puteana RWD-64-598 SS2]
MNHGSVAIAIVQHQVVVVQAARDHSCRDNWLDVYTYTPFGDHLFLASCVPRARIAPSDILAVFPFPSETIDMIELPDKAYEDYLALSAKHQKQKESLWKSLKTRLR